MKKMNRNPLNDLRYAIADRVLEWADPATDDPDVSVLVLAPPGLLQTNLLLMGRYRKSLQVRLLHDWTQIADVTERFCKAAAGLCPVVAVVMKDSWLRGQSTRQFDAGAFERIAPLADHVKASGGELRVFFTGPDCWGQIKVASKNCPWIWYAESQSVCIVQRDTSPQKKGVDDTAHADDVSTTQGTGLQSWVRAGDEPRPDEYQFGPLLANKREASLLLYPGEPIDVRRLEMKARSGIVWVQHQGGRRYAWWFRHKGYFDAAAKQQFKIDERRAKLEQQRSEAQKQRRDRERKEKGESAV